MDPPFRIPPLGSSIAGVGPRPASTWGAARPAAVDWKLWTRALERKRRAWVRGRRGGRRLSRAYLAHVTRVSFEMDGMQVTEADGAAALSRGSAGRAFRSRQAQRLRNHVAILRRIETALRRGQTITAAVALRWYTSIASGLPISQVGEQTVSRLERVAQQINSPHLHLRPAVEEIAALYRELLADPLVPSFNGILARLLLACHLGRCGLPPLLFQPEVDRLPPADAGQLLRRLLDLIDRSYDALLAEAKASA